MHDSSSSVWRQKLLAVLILFLSSLNAFGQNKTVAERLGYPRDAKLLIIHGDDLGSTHSVDAASFDALEKGVVTSASIMVPCPWLTEVAAYAKDHPEADLGLHLTLTSEWATYRWGPISSKHEVSSLLDPSGYFWADTESAARAANPADVEREIHAQIARARELGIVPTHLDSHMGVLFSRPDLFEVYVKVAHAYKLPFLAVRSWPQAHLAMLSENDVILNAIICANPAIPPEQWTSFYVDAIRNLEPGITQLIVHVGQDDAELQAVMFNHPDFGAAWRQRDYDVVSSPEFRRALEENNIILIKWKDLKQLLD